MEVKTAGNLKKIFDLHYIVKSVQADLGENHTGNFKRYFKWAIDGYRRIKLANVIPYDFTSVRLTMDENRNWVDLPADYLEYRKIGLCVPFNGTEYLLTLDVNDNICIPKDHPCDCAVQIPEAVDAITRGDFDYFQNYYGYIGYYHNQQFVAGHFGLGEGFYGGGYRIDEENGRIHFDSYITQNDIVLEYRSSGIPENGNARIKETMIPVLVNYVHWMIAKHKRRKSAIDVRVAKQDFVRELKALNHKKLSFTKAEFLQSDRRSVHQLPKR